MAASLALDEWMRCDAASGRFARPHRSASRKECIHMLFAVPNLADPFAPAGEPPVEGINPKYPPPEPMPG
jgi:hypothetical protein